MPAPSAVPANTRAGRRASHARTAASTACACRWRRNDSGTPPQMPTVSGPACEWSAWTTTWSEATPVRRATSWRRW